MKNIHFSKRKLFSSFIASILVCTFALTPISHVLEVKKANAITVWDPGNYIPNWGTFIESSVSSVSNAATSISTNSLTFKEYVLDNIVWPIINIVLQGMIRDTTRWVNSGFNGSPAFVSNLETYMTNAADQVAGNLIWKGGLEELCSPFKLNIQLALDIQYSKTRGNYKAQCTLSAVSKNIESFLAGDFISGDWDDWYDVTLKPENNPYGAMLDAQAGISLGISNSQKRSQSMLNFGNGFLSSEVCDPVCHTVTPGAVIEGQLNSSLGGAQRRVEVADELNELVGALFAQLASTAIGGVGGLLGLTSNSGSGGGDYFDAMAAERRVTMYDGSETENPFSSVLATQQTFLDQQNEIIQIITDAASYEDSVYGDSCNASGNLTSSLNTKLNSASTSRAQVIILIEKLTEYNTDYSLLSSESTSPSIITSLLIKYDEVNVFEAESTLMTEYSLYTTSGTLHTTEETVRLRLSTIPDIKTEVSSFKTNIDYQCRDTNSGN